MQVQREQPDDDIDFDSFVQAQRKATDESSGKVILKKCSLVENSNELPEGYRENYSEFSFEEYFIFKAEDTGSGESKKVITPNNSDELEFTKHWTEEESISGLAGSKVPVRHVNENSWRVERLDRSFILTPSILRKMEQKNYLEYQLLVIQQFYSAN